MSLAIRVVMYTYSWHHRFGASPFGNKIPLNQFTHAVDSNEWCRTCCMYHCFRTCTSIAVVKSPFHFVKDSTQIWHPLPLIYLISGLTVTNMYSQSSHKKTVRSLFHCTCCLFHSYIIQYQFNVLLINNASYEMLPMPINLYDLRMIIVIFCSKFVFETCL